MSMRPSFLLVGEAGFSGLSVYSATHITKSDEVQLEQLGTFPVEVKSSKHTVVSDSVALDVSGVPIVQAVDSVHGHTSRVKLIVRTFEALFITTLEPTLQSTSITFNSTDASSSSVTDFEGVVWDICDYTEAKFQGTRRVQNLLTDSEHIESTKYGPYLQTYGGSKTVIGSTYFSAVWPYSYLNWARATSVGVRGRQARLDNYSGLNQIHQFYSRQGPAVVEDRIATRVDDSGDTQSHPVVTDWELIAHHATAFTDAVDGVVIYSPGGAKNEAWELADLQVTPFMTSSTYKMPGEYVSNASANDTHGTNATGVQYFTYENATYASASTYVYAVGSAIDDLSIPGIALASTVIEIPTAHINTEEGAIIFAVTPRTENGPILHWSTAAVSSLAVRLSGGILHYDAGDYTLQSLASLEIDTEYVVGISWGSESKLYIDGVEQETDDMVTTVDTQASVLYVGGDGAGSYADINIRGVV